MRPILGSRRTRIRLLSLFAVLAMGVTALPALASGGTATCAEPLAVLSPTGSAGDLTAVAVTSQVLDRGVDGWAEVSWETFDGTELTSVTLVHAEGERVLTQDLATGSASEVIELVFCGTAGGDR